MLSVQPQNDLFLMAVKPQSSEDTQAWQAVLERDRRYDGLFVYAVRSTGIYCRPSCPSRRPRAEQVEFFEQPKAAEGAGYRSCKRCHPTENGLQAALPTAITRVCRFLDQATEEVPKLEQMAGLVKMSPFHLQRTFKQALGVSPREYAELRRFLRFRTRLQKGDDVTTAMYEAGFNSPSRLVRAFDFSPGYDAFRVQSWWSGNEDRIHHRRDKSRASAGCTNRERCLRGSDR